MEVHRQQCQKCGSRNMKNIIYREHDEIVFVQCRHCHEFVARYVISPGGYFHYGRGFESYLRSIKRSGEVPSGRKFKEKYEELEQICLEGFKKVLEILKEDNKSED